MQICCAFKKDVGPGTECVTVSSLLLNADLCFYSFQVSDLQRENAVGGLVSCEYPHDVHGGEEESEFNALVMADGISSAPVLSLVSLERINPA